MCVCVLTVSRLTDVFLNTSTRTGAVYSTDASAVLGEERKTGRAYGGGLPGRVRVPGPGVRAELEGDRGDVFRRLALAFYVVSCVEPVVFPGEERKTRVSEGKMKGGGREVRTGRASRLRTL